MLATDTDIIVNTAKKLIKSDIKINVKQTPNIYYNSKDRYHTIGFNTFNKDVCLIIDNKRFDNKNKCPTRCGSRRDAQRLKQVFIQLDFDVKSYSLIETKQQIR